MPAPRDYQRHISGTQDKGIDTFNPDIAADVTWDESTVNVSGGVRRGVSPRYGTAPLPGHADNENSTGTRCNGLYKSEARYNDASPGQGCTDREKIYAILPIELASYLDLKSRRTFYAYVIHRLRSGGSEGGEVYDLVFGSTFDSGTSTFRHSPNISAGLSANTRTTAFNVNTAQPIGELVFNVGSNQNSALQALLEDSTPARFLSTALFTVPGIDVPFRTYVGLTTSTPDATTAPDVNLNYVDTGDPNKNWAAGANTEFQLQNFKETDRNLTFVCLDEDGGQLMGYTLELTPTTSTFQAVYNMLTADPHLIASGPTATKIGSSTAYGDVVATYVKDPEATTNSAYKAIAIAAAKPVLGIIQEWSRNVNGTLVNWVGLNDNAMQPRSRDTTDYQENGIDTPSCFASFPPFVAGVALSPVTGLEVNIVTAATGLLAENTDYELTFSTYYKRLNYETNVGTPVKFRTGGSGPYGLKISEPQSPGFTNYSDIQTGGKKNLLPFLGRTGSNVSVNNLEYRFYYRPLGSFEWLPAGNIDAADYWFGPFMDDYTILDKPVATTTGGQPGGFNDYSPLPKDDYFQTLSFKDRAFWFSKRSVSFSNKNNLLAYSTRNQFQLSTGECRGGISHTRRGEVAQNSRLIVFASDQTYVGFFTGVKQQQEIRVSATASGFFDVDGSDFEIDYHTDAISYGYRAAVVAEGDLYFWGPKGVYRDDGIIKPVKISQRLESEILDLVDTGKIEQIHSVYNDRTSEIIWFYRPKEADADFPTHGLIYNVENDRFYLTKFRFYIDASQIIAIDNCDTNQGVSGDRVLLHGSSTEDGDIQRSFFMDDLCKSGDQGPTRELMVKEVSTPETGKRRLTVAAGSLDTSNIAAGDFIAVENAKGYASSIVANDFLALVDTVDPAYIDILIPSGASLDDISLSTPDFFPVYHRGATTQGQHGITYQVQTNYWLPGGIDNAWIWEFFYMLFKLSKWPSPSPTRGADYPINQIDLSYKALMADAFRTDAIDMVENSDGHWQILHGLSQENQVSQGQAIKYRFSGIHIGHQWTLEYLEALCLIEKGFTLKEFEDLD